MRGGFPEGLSCIAFNRNDGKYVYVCVYVYRHFD